MYIYTYTHMCVYIEGVMIFSIVKAGWNFPNCSCVKRLIEKTRNII